MDKLDLSDEEVAYIKYGFPARNLVYWELGNFCTYKCSYCTDPYNSGSNPYQDIKVVQETLKKLPISLVMFSGGEPTFHPNFEQIVLEKPDHIRMGVVSNASRPLSFWERLGPNLSIATLSYHSEFANLDRFMKVANLVFNVNKTQGRVNVIMIPWLWEECVEAYNAFFAAGISVVAKQLLKSFGNGCTGSVIEYTPEQIEWLAARSSSLSPGPDTPLINIYNKDHKVIRSTSAVELFANDQTNFHGWNCRVPEQYLVIHSNGTATNTSCDQKQIVGDIYNGFTFPNPAIICEQKLCWCYSDIAGTKSPPTYTGHVPNTIIKIIRNK